MKHLRLGARVFLLFMMVASGLAGAFGGSQALAQSGATSFVSPMTGIPITASGPWSVDTSSVFSQDGIESVTIMSEFEFMQVWFMPGNVDLVEARDVVLDSYAQTFGTFVEIDRGAYGNVSYSLDITSSEGIEFGVFSLFLGQRDSGYVEYYVYFGAISLFAQGFASAQQNVTVNNTAVFGGVDGAGLQNLLLANAGVTGSSPSTTTQAPPVPTTEPQQPTQPTQPPAQPTPPPAEPTQAPADTTQQTGGSLTPEQSTYLQTVRSEIDTLEGSIFEFLVVFGEFSQGSASDETVDYMRSLVTMWADYPQTSASIVAPAGMEDVDGQFRNIGNSFATASATFMSAMEAGANGDQAALDQGLSDLSTQLETIFTDISTLRALIDQYEQAGGTAQQTDPPAQPTVDAPTGGLNAEQMAYVQTVRSEISMLETSMDDFQTTFTAYLDGTVANQDQAIQDINAAVSMWGAYPQTASTIVAPAGMEDVDASYQAIATSLSGASQTFQAAIQAGADGDTAGSQTLMEQFIDEFSAVYTQIDELNTLLDQYEQTGGTAQQTEPPTQPAEPPAQPTAEPEPTQETTTTTTTETGDGGAYTEAISGEIEAIWGSVSSFYEGAQLLGSTDTAEQDQGVAMISESVEFWATYDQVAAGITAPAGYEDVDAAYQQLAQDVTELATLFDAWLSAPDASRDAAGDEFSAALTDVEAQLEALNTLIGAPVPEDTSTTTTTTETEDVPEDITETGNRGQLPELPSDDDDPADTGAGDYEDLGLVSETEYVSPQYDLEVVWDDRWAFDGDFIEDAIGSDEENGEDWITLIWTGGDSGDITISVAEVDGFEPDVMVEYWESSEYLDQLPVEGEVVLAEASRDRGGVLILLEDEGSAIYREAVCLSRSCDEVAFVMVISSVVDAPDLIADAEEGIEIEGEAATGVFSTREINRALDQ